MKNKFGGLLLLLSAILCIGFAFFHFHFDFWLLPPHQKLSIALRKDLANLEALKKLPKGWDQIREIIVKTDNSPLSEWAPKTFLPIPVNKNGRYKLEIFFVLLLDGHRYGTVAEFNLFDYETNNKVSEFGRTYRLGFIY